MKRSNIKILALNKRAKVDYEIIETFEAGIKLQGHEVKAVKLAKVSLKAAFIIIKNREAFLINSKISQYQSHNSPKDYDIERERRLLLNKKEIIYLESKRQLGFVIIPLKMYIRNNFIKLEIALAKSLKKYDKKQKLIEKQVKRDIDRGFRQKV